MVSVSENWTPAPAAAAPSDRRSRRRVRRRGTATNRRGYRDPARRRPRSRRREATVGSGRRCPWAPLPRWLRVAMYRPARSRQPGRRRTAAVTGLRIWSMTACDGRCDFSGFEKSNPTRSVSRSERSKLTGRRSTWVSCL